MITWILTIWLITADFNLRIYSTQEFNSYEDCIEVLKDADIEGSFIASCEEKNESIDT